MNKIAIVIGCVVTVIVILFGIVFLVRKTDNTVSNDNVVNYVICFDKPLPGKTELCYQLRTKDGYFITKDGEKYEFFKDGVKITEISEILKLINDKDYSQK